MVKRSVEIFPAFKIYITSLFHQLFISSSVNKHEPDIDLCVEKIYDRIAEILSGSSSRIVHERCFGSIGSREQILDIRNRAFSKYKIETDTPITYIEGESCFGNKFSGVQVRAIKSAPEIKIRTILDRGIPKGRAWDLNGSTFFMLHDINGLNPGDKKDTSRISQSESMFQRANDLLFAEGAKYYDVVRTWIYISDILDWYDDFNSVRNNCYSEYGFLADKDSGLQAEQIFLPASTGIEGKNPSGASTTMDIFAVHRSPESSVQIRPLYSAKQLSPFRYGSAFSRAVVVEEPGSKQILVSGTASIDDQGRTLFIGNPEAQIRHTLDIVASLVALEGASLKDLCEATVFLKHRQALPVFQKVLEQMEIASMPSVNVVADVCRDELLFELDAAFIIKK